MKTCENNIATTNQVKRNERGFTLIELLVACGIIAILIGLLLPAIQKQREEFAHDEATTNVNALIVASQEYFNRVGSYPSRIDDLVGWNLINSQTPVDPDLARGKKNGYLYQIVEAGQDHCTIEAEPEFPGITGSITHTWDSDLNSITSNPTPGADEAREQMFNRIRAKAAETVVKLLGLDPAATSQVREYSESADNQASIVDYIDSDEDGRVSLAEVQFTNTTFDDPSVTDLVLGFLAYVAQEMKWDTLSQEAKTSIAVDISSLDDEPSRQPPLFSYDGLSILTITVFGQSGDDAITLIEILAAAKAAEESSDQRAESKAIKSYQKGVKAQINRAITRSNSKTLVTMSKTL